MIGSSLLMGSFGFMMYSVNSAFASESKKYPYQSIPVNQDGTITIRLSQEQLKLIAPPDIQKVDIVQIRGTAVDFYEGKKDSDRVYGLGTCAGHCN